MEKMQGISHFSTDLSEEEHFMIVEELFSKQSEEEKKQEKKKKRSLMQCPKCKGRNVSVQHKQVRSADEGMTAFCHCRDCNQKWKE